MRAAVSGWIGGVADHVDGAVGAHRQAVAQVRLGVGRGDRGDHDLGGDALVAQAQGFFQGDFVERVGRQLDAVGDHAGAVRLDLDADVVVHHALVADEDLHWLWFSFVSVCVADMGEHDPTILLVSLLISLARVLRGPERGLQPAPRADAIMRGPRSPRRGRATASRRSP